jgi:CDP-glucose 4,6-dehydratase
MSDTFKDKKVLITGHTGFKGSWLSFWLNSIGAKVSGISLDPLSIPSNYDALKLNNHINDLRLDIRNTSKTISIINEIQPDFVFHLAAQSLVGPAYDNPINTWETNLLGTVNILEAIRQNDKKCCAVIITSDKCYDNQEWLWGYKETDKLGGPDPYSASKGAAEIAINSYYKSFFSKNDHIRIASARAGNVIGGGDWSNLRIIPDCIKAWSKKENLVLRNPFATRPWQHVFEPLSGYMQLAESLNASDKHNGESFNFGPSSEQNYSVQELVSQMSKLWKDSKWEVHKEADISFYESKLLKLNCEKALADLNWKSVLSFNENINFTSEWYQEFYKNESQLIDFSLKQLEDYKKIRSERI